MNIFRLHDDPYIAASYHCDKHVVKMVMESAQLLSTAHGGGPGMCKPTHQNHPCAIWARESKGNYAWLYKLGVALCAHYTLRYGKHHAYEPMFERELRRLPSGIILLEETPAPQCMPDHYRVEGDPVAAYRQYYRGDKMRFARWRYTEPPPWLQPNLEEQHHDQSTV